MILSFAVLFVIVFLLFLLYRREKKAFFALLWFSFFIFPVANIIVVLKPQMMALRYLYIPSIGLALFLGVIIDKIFPKPVVFLVAFVLLLSFKTYTQNKYWKDGVSLNEKMVQDAPSSVIARNNLGVAYLHDGMPLKALLEFQKAVELDPANSFAAFNLGNTYQKFSRFDEAILYLKKAIEINPSYSRAYNSIGMIYQKKGQYQNAEKEFERALETASSNYLAHYNLANLLTIMKREDEATDHYIEFVKLAPAAYEKKKLFVRKILLMKGIVVE